MMDRLTVSMMDRLTVSIMDRLTVSIMDRRLTVSRDADGHFHCGLNFHQSVG